MVVYRKVIILCKEWIIMIYSNYFIDFLLLIKNLKLICLNFSDLLVFRGLIKLDY